MKCSFRLPCSAALLLFGAHLCFAQPQRYFGPYSGMLNDYVRNAQFIKSSTAENPAK
jgi:hypothetical protein